VSDRAKPKFTNWKVPARDGKLRVGFVSGDLRNHAVGYFVEGLLEHLVMGQFEIFAFPTTSITDDLTNRIKQLFTDWTPIYGMSDQAAATLIHQKEIHVLIDLSGHSAHNRLPVFSYKPAPVQVSWLGYFATTGLPEMDYFLGDPQMSPKSEATYFTETVWSLPETWLCHKPHAQIVSVSELPALKDGFLTFGSFGNLSKMNNQVVETWSSILHRTPTSKLLLKSHQLGDPSQREEVKNRYQKFNISPDRLILEGPESRESYFEAYQRLDVVLDTFPYPGGTTSVDSLWMGVPVLTLKGDRFLSHLGESIVFNSGNSDWLASDVEDYIAKAVLFTTDLEQLAQLRSTLRDRILKSPLFDTSRFAKNFGDACWGMLNQGSQSKVALV
jgi:predicted O-linked N-acetylglucosamine transferase (SPINDLY family)